MRMMRLQSRRDKPEWSRSSTSNDAVETEMRDCTGAGPVVASGRPVCGRETAGNQHFVLGRSQIRAVPRPERVSQPSWPPNSLHPQAMIYLRLSKHAGRQVASVAVRRRLTVNTSEAS
jgi:hypothetical protein